MTYLMTPEQTLSAARHGGLDDEILSLRGVAVLTFSKTVVDRLTGLCGLKDASWLGPQRHPYATADVVKRGTYKELDITLLVPPMGASPLACIIEDLVACGVRGVFLVCASWSLGPPVRFGDMIVPTFSVGHDGTSIHYGNDSDRVQADSVVVEALAEACRKQRVTVHVGGNASCEAFYRITPEMAQRYRGLGCLCMENGEASTLLAVTKTLRIAGGVLFQPYIELARGWDPNSVNEWYRTTCRLQADAVLEACTKLKQQGLLDT